MIKLIECEGDFPATWCVDDAFSARITALFATYGTAYPFAEFWYQQIGGEILALISRIDGAMTVSFIPQADREEILSFADTVGYSSLMCSQDLLSGQGSYIVEFIGDKSGSIQNEPQGNMREVYDLLTECGFKMGEYESYLADFCARLRKGTACLAEKCVNGSLASTASALFIGGNSVLLGAVATAQNYRGKGYAGELVMSLAAAFPGKRVFLFCREDSLLEFYRKLGFVEVGRWSLTEG